MLLIMFSLLMAVAMLFAAMKTVADEDSRVPVRTDGQDRVNRQR